MSAYKTPLCLALYVTGLMLCILPPLLAVISYFPIWKDRGVAAVISGFSLLLIALCFIPFFKTVKRILTSPASYTVWLIIFIVFLAVSKIAEEMVVISFFGFVGNLLGAILFKLTRKYGERGNEKQL